MPNTSAVNAAPVNASTGDSGDSGSVVTVGLRCRAYLPGTARLALWLRTWEQGGALAQVGPQTFLRGLAQAPLQLIAGRLAAQGQAQAGLTVLLVGTGTASSAPGHLWVSVYQSVSTTPVPPGQTPPVGSVGGAYHTWCVSAAGFQITGTVTVNAEENGARTSSLSVLGDATPSTGAGIALSLNVGGAQSLLYRGRIVRAQYNPDTEVTALSCSDGLQEVADRLSAAQIDALTPDAISPPGDTSTGYARLMARLSTVPKSAILRRDGTIAVVPWKVTGGGYTSRILHGAFTLERTAPPAESASDPNSSSSTPTPVATVRRKAWRLTINLSWIRIAKMTFRGGWSSGDIDLCKWLMQHYPLPQEDTIRQAVQGCGWDVESLATARMSLRSQWIGCPGSPLVGLLVAPGTVAPATYAQWVLSKRYTRTMRARAVWMLRDKAARPQDPLDITDLQVSVKDPRDGRDWVDFAAGDLTQTDANGDEYADLLDIRDAAAQFGTPLQAAQSQITDAMQRIAVTMAQAAVKLAQQRRTGSATATTLIDPTLDIGQPLTLAHPKLSFGGMIRRITHTLDTARGSATTTVEVAQYQDPETEAIPPGWPANSVHTVALGNLTGGLLAKTLLQANNVPTRLSSTPLPKPAQNLIGGVSPYLVQADPTADPLFQGWVANKPQSVMWAYGAQPPFNPEYPTTGFFVRSPDIELPDQNTPLDLGQSLLLI